MIKAPFNFVPLNESPYLPKWADQISQDIPFEDGLLGKLKLRIDAETPIFVNDKVQEENSVPCEFCHVLDSEGNKHYFIPGTSIKGVLRNVMEILSFGKMTQVQNQSFGIRDLSNGADGKFYREKVKVDKVHCGWLRMDEDGYLLDDCGLPWRISAEELDRHFGMGLMNFITNGVNFRSDENKTARKKYEMFRVNHTDSQLTDYFSVDNNININAGGRKFVCFNRGGNDGTIVFTGQPGLRQQKFDRKKNKMVWSGKFFEFVFPSQIEKRDVPVPEIVFKEFESIHQNSSDYTEFRKKELKRGEEIPVFFIYDENGKIDTMGISYMYKFPAFNSVYNGIPMSLLDNNARDLCECIFGFTDKENSLKGRVQFAPASLCGAPSFCSDVTLALAKPHPSYYPLYLGKGQTWNAGDIRIAGRKRYPARSQDSLLINSGTDKMSRVIRPMSPNVTFEGYVHFFNLRPVELGALLSAIDFCQHEECSHNIGQGKPLGYGKAKLTIVGSEIESISTMKPYSLNEAREAFVSEMEKQFPGWATSPQLTELFAMAKGIPSEKLSHFRYMKMSTTSEENEFKKGLDAYSQGEQLGSFTQIVSGNVPHITQQSNVSVNAKRENVELQLAKEQKERELALARQKEMKEKELAKKCEEELFMQRKLRSEEIAEQAREAFAQNNFVEAKRLFEEAASYQFDTYQAKIDECQMKLDGIKILNADIASYLEKVKLASIPAFANNLKKRNSSTPITTSDIPYIIQKIGADWSGLKPADRKSWLDRKKWAPIEKELGVDITNEIFDGIKNLPIK